MRNCSVGKGTPKCFRKLKTTMLAALLSAGLTVSAAAAPVRSIVIAGSARISVIGEGKGPLVVMLPSRGRDSQDYDKVAAAIADKGYRVLRPQPRGIDGSTGPMTNITLHDLAGDVSAVIQAEKDGPAVIIGHAYGNWIARMIAVDSPVLVRGVVLAASAAKSFPPALSVAVTKSSDMSLPDAERRVYLQSTFFAAGNDPSAWLTGWWPDASLSQREAADRTKQSEWWTGGSVPLLDLQAGDDPFRPASTRDDLKKELGNRVTIAVIPHTSHALLPEAPVAVATAVTTWLRTLP